MSVTEADERHPDHLRSLGRKRSTLMDHESTLRVHLCPFLPPPLTKQAALIQAEGGVSVKLHRVSLELGCLAAPSPQRGPG